MLSVLDVCIVPLSIACTFYNEKTLMIKVLQLLHRGVISIQYLRCNIFVKIVHVRLGSNYKLVTHTFYVPLKHDLFRAVMVKVTYMFGPLETVV